MRSVLTSKPPKTTINSVARQLLGSRQWWTQLTYLLHETWLGLQRGGWMNWAAISTVTVLLFLFGTGLSASWQVERIVHQVGSQLEVSVYLQPGVAGATLQTQVAQVPEVATVTLVNKEQAWQQLLQDLGAANMPAATQGLETNPLVDQLQVRATSVTAVPQLVKQLQALPGVDAVQYLDQALQQLEKLQQGLRWLGLGVMGLLTLTAIAVISTTIRLIVLARAQEIEIFQLVGATRSWIYGPFLIQGLSFGWLGAALAGLGLLAVQQTLVTLLGQQPELLRLLAGGLPLPLAQSLGLLLCLFALGGVVGLCGSFLAVRRLR